ncbi:MAG: proton-conducting transporter membrane subunit [Kiritimatiellia bacterium]|nr:proton-conducting transporter membrane subunit [Kiritimatiellia bacterium]
MATLLQHLPALLVAVPLFAAFTLPLVGRTGAPARTAWVFLGALLTAATGLLLAWQVFAHGPLLYVFGAAAPHVPTPMDSGGIPIRIIFQIDALGALMVVIASLSSLAIILYSLASDSRHSGKDSFYSLLFLLVAGVLGMVSTGDLFNFFVFLEISSLSGAALVAYRVDKGQAVEAGLKYALLSTVGALAFLVAVGLLFAQYNALNIAVVASRLQFTPLDQIALVLLAIPLAMKCGAVPMHFWTPDAYSTAPSSITAFLVVSSQASLYGLFRILFSLYGHLLEFSWLTFGWFLIILGVLSMFIGVTMAIPQKDVKRLMAYHAVSQTGYMLLGVGVGLAVLGNRDALDAYGRTAMAGGLFHILNHAMYKGLLFLTAGAIFFRTGTRNLNKLGGLGHHMPWTMVFFMIGALAIAGIPPFNGFASKFLIYESVFRFSPFLSIIAMLVSILTLASFVKVFHAMFMGAARTEFAQVREVPIPMIAGMAILAAVVIVTGLMPRPFIDHMILPAVNALVDRADYIAAILGGH